MKSGLYKTSLIEMEKPLIENTLVKTSGNQIMAAKLLGINRNTLHAKVKRLGIDINYFKNIQK